MNRAIAFLFLAVLFALPVVVGCGGGGGSGSNPLAPSVVSQSAPTDNHSTANFVACKYVKPVAPKFTYLKSDQTVVYHMREGLERAKAALKLWFSGLEQDKLTFFFNSVTVYPVSGNKIRYDFAKSIDFSDPKQLSDAIGSLNLPAGQYKKFELGIEKAEILDGNKTYDVTLLNLSLNKKITFIGRFEIKDGYYTNMRFRFLHRPVKIKSLLFPNKYYYTLLPLVKITSELELIPPVITVTTGGIKGTVVNLVTNAKLANIEVKLDGTELVATTDANGDFAFAELLPAVYNLKINNADYLDFVASVSVEVGQDAETALKIHPALIKSTVGETGWFSRYYPNSEAAGQYAELGLETPISIDFVSMAFTKAEIVFTAEHALAGSALSFNYLATKQQVSADTDLGTWWCGNTATTENFLGNAYATPSPGTAYTVDVTDIIRNNPSSAYFFASRNVSYSNIRLTNIQITIYYR